MNTELKVTLVQADLAWHDAEKNRRHFDVLTASLAGQTDLVVLPEMFTTGFTMEAEKVAEAAVGPTTQWMQQLAQRLKAVITGSVVIQTPSGYFNRLIWMRPDGSYATYDKRHLFRMATEHQHYGAGVQRVTFDLAGWKVCPLICYDLRFPVWSRNRIGGEGDYDLLLYVANWPERRAYAWRTLLRARAIENLSYCVGVNRVGRDGTGVGHAGESVALDFLGQPMCPELAGECVETVTLDRAALMAFRARFPAHLDADDFELL